MRQFFTILFGGLIAIATGLILVWGLLQAGQWFSTNILGLDGARGSSSVAAAGMASGALTDQSTISGLTRIIRYTASEEEDLINKTALALPSGADSRITAEAYIVMDLTTGTEVAQYNQERLLPVASLTKLVTAMVARKYIPADARITLTAEVISTYGNTALFRVGETFAASDLLYPLLMVSSNDAAEAYARHFGRKQFVQAMNDFVQSIGAYRTVFEDPSGLSPRNQSTAVDMAIIIDWIRLHDPEIISITDQKSKTVRNHTWVNPTHFLSWSYYRGGKNGYTDEADRTSVGLFAIGRSQDTYAVVVLGSDDRDGDVIKLLNKIR